METQQISIPRSEARGLYREYKKHLHYSQPMDREIMRAYQLMAQGRVIIKAIESIRKAGVDTDGLPRLAICRADATVCTLQVPHGHGVCSFHAGEGWRSLNSKASANQIVVGDFPGVIGWSGRRGHRSDWQTVVPPVPLHLRPKRGLQNYHILWEVTEWKKVPPHDPYLLRRIGKGDLWVVLAMWDLTEVERAVLSSRLANA